jgi:hypothetical protein
VLAYETRYLRLGADRPGDQTIAGLTALTSLRKAPAGGHQGTYGTPWRAD